MEKKKVAETKKYEAYKKSLKAKYNKKLGEVMSKQRKIYIKKVKEIEKKIANEEKNFKALKKKFAKEALMKWRP